MTTRHDAQLRAVQMAEDSKGAVVEGASFRVQWCSQPSCCFKNKMKANRLKSEHRVQGMFVPPEQGTSCRPFRFWRIRVWRKGKGVCFLKAKTGDSLCLSRKTEPPSVPGWLVTSGLSPQLHGSADMGTGVSAWTGCALRAWLPAPLPLV